MRSWLFSVTFGSSADGVTLAQLRDQDPELHELVTSSYASSGTYLDATLTRPQPPVLCGLIDATFTP